jgi:hypothetical protein
VTQQNAAMVEESTAASHALADQAQELERLMGQFRTPETATTEHRRRWGRRTGRRAQRISAHLARTDRSIAIRRRRKSVRPPFPVTSPANGGWDCAA